MLLIEHADQVAGQVLVGGDPRGFHLIGRRTHLAFGALSLEESVEIGCAVASHAAGSRSGAEARTAP